jgi:predicted dehydrogenase
VIGLGLFGRHHAAVLASARNAELILCVDRDPEREAVCPPGVRFSTDLTAIGASPIDAVIVACDDGAHRAATEAALAAGAAVLCEKPLAPSVEDADAMLAAAVAADRPLWVAHTLRFEPRYRRIREAVERGELGDIVQLAARRATWAPEGRIYGSQTRLELCLGVHDLDVMRWLAGEIERVHAEATAADISGSASDAVAATLRFRSGAIGSLELSWALPEATGVAWDTALHCIGTERSLYVALRGTDDSRIGEAGDVFPDLSYVYEVDGIPGGVVRLQDEHFLRAVRSPDSWPGASATDGRRAVEAALALVRSAESGQPVSLS